jgi:hypothetical protein
MTIRIHDPIYHAEIFLFLYPRDKITDVVKKRLNCDYSPSLNHKAESLSIECKETGWTEYIIWMPKFNWSIDDQQCLAHEIFHTACRVLEDRGIKFDPERHEAHAYYFDWIFGELWNKLKPRHNKFRRKDKR